MNNSSDNSMPEIQESSDASPSRRSFMKLAVGGMCAGYAAVIGYPVYRYLNSPVEKAAATAAVKEVSLPGADTLPKGTAMVFKFGSHPALLIHHDDDSWTAMTAVCTHLGCTVQFDPNEKKIVCACHGGVYDAKSGGNISGPPPKPLETYTVAHEPGSVTVKRTDVALSRGLGRNA